MPLPSRPRHLQEQGIAERGGGYVKDNALKGRRFDGLEELDSQTETLEPYRGPTAQGKTFLNCRTSVIFLL